MVKSYIKAIVIIIVLFFLVTFGIKNSNSVSISYYFGLFDAMVPMYAVVYACLVLGIIIGMLIGFAGRLGIKRKLKAAEKEKKEILSELEVMRSKAAVPVYNENMYVPEARPAPVEEENKPTVGFGDGSAY